MQIRSRDLSKPKKTLFVKWELLSYFLKLWLYFHYFKIIRYIVSTLGKVNILEKKLLKKQSILMGDWVLVEKTVYFQNQLNI